MVALRQLLFSSNIYESTRSRTNTQHGGCSLCLTCGRSSKAPLMDNESHSHSCSIITTGDVESMHVLESNKRPYHPITLFRPRNHCVTTTPSNLMQLLYLSLFSIKLSTACYLIPGVVVSVSCFPLLRPLSSNRHESSERMLERLPIRQ